MDEREIKTLMNAFDIKEENKEIVKNYLSRPSISSEDVSMLPINIEILSKINVQGKNITFVDEPI